MPLRELLLVRHGESLGNVARELAEGSGSELIDIDVRDPDVVLSDLGREQARALGVMLRELAADNAPTCAWTSPYVRASETLSLALDEAELAIPVTVDERLRDRELGVLDRLTGLGVRTRFPEEAARRRYLGKMYYRPSGGESWADVALRLRSVIRDIEAGCAEADERVLVTTHDAVIMLFRYILEPLTEQAVLELAARASVRNASVTRLVRQTGGWTVEMSDAVGHLELVGVEETEHGRSGTSDFGSTRAAGREATGG